MNASAVMGQGASMRHSSWIPPEDRRITPTLVFLFPFAVTTLTLNCIPGFSDVAWGLGVACAVMFLGSLIVGRFTLPPEVFIYVAFQAWATLGLSSAMNVGDFQSRYFTLAQHGVLLAVTTHCVRNRRSLHIMMWAYFLGSVLVGISAFTSGDYARAEANQQRAAGLAINANRLAMILLQCSAILLYVIGASRRKLLRLAAVGLLLIFVLLIVASGSRTGFVGFGVLLLVWLWFAYAREIRRRPGALIVGVVVVAMLGGFAAYRFRGSLLASRMRSLVKESDYASRDASAEVRLGMWGTAWQYFQSHPLVGIGLGQTQDITTSHRMMHVDYLEVVVATGLPGFLLYYSLFAVVLLRLRRLRRLCAHDQPYLMLVSFGLTVIWLRLIIDLAATSWQSKEAWILTAIVMGWSFHFERHLRQVQAQPALVATSGRRAYGVT